MKKAYIMTTALLTAAFLSGCGTAASAGKNEISEEKAKTTAFQHAGIDEKDVSSLKVSKEKENGTDVYAIEFISGDKEYDYDISRSAGDIISSSYQPVTDAKNTPGTADSAAANTDTKENTSASNDKSTENKSTAAQSSSSAMTKDKAKSIALNNANVKESNVRRMKIENKWEDGQEIYSVSFYADDVKYEYEIAKTNGAVLDADRDYEGDEGTPSKDMISKSKAESIALNKVTGAKQSHIYLRFERDDGQYLYEGEIVYNDKEYDFEIDAYTGNIMKWSVENLH